jgi:DNA polymerase III epsilon subunit family exonuclease
MVILDKPLAIFDLETTEDADGNHYIVEIGAVKIDTTLERVDLFQSFVRPPVDIPEHMTAIHGITEEMVANQPAWNEIGDQFARWCNYKSVRLSGWGVHFDINVLRNEYRRHNREFPHVGAVLDVKSIAMFWGMWQGYKFPKGWGISEVCSRWGIEPPNKAHRALDDALATARILTYIAEKME